LSEARHVENRRPDPQGRIYAWIQAASARRFQAKIRADFSVAGVRQWLNRFYAAKAGQAQGSAPAHSSVARPGVRISAVQCAQKPISAIQRLKYRVVAPHAQFETLPPQV